MEQMLSQMLEGYENGKLSITDAVMDALKQGLKPQRPSGSDRIYFPDPDGLEVQNDHA